MNKKNEEEEEEKERRKVEDFHFFSFSFFSFSFFFFRDYNVKGRCSTSSWCQGFIALSFCFLTSYKGRCLDEDCQHQRK